MYHLTFMVLHCNFRLLRVSNIPHRRGPYYAVCIIMQLKGKGEILIILFTVHLTWRRNTDIVFVFSDLKLQENNHRMENIDFFFSLKMQSSGISIYNDANRSEILFIFKEVVVMSKPILLTNLKKIYYKKLYSLVLIRFKMNEFLNTIYYQHSNMSFILCLF